MDSAVESRDGIKPMTTKGPNLVGLAYAIIIAFGFLVITILLLEDGNG